MKWVEPRVSLPFLACLAAAVLLTVGATEYRAHRGRGVLRAEAAARMRQAITRLAQVRTERGIPFSSEDTGHTGIVGEEMTPLVTTLGSLGAKRMATDPAFASLAADLFLDLGLKGGDVIAVGLSGSLPGLNIAVLSAAQALGLLPLVISSVGASQWGATDPRFTWLDMAHAMRESGLFRFQAVAAARGGGLGGNFLLEEGWAMAGEAIRRNGLRELAGTSLHAQVRLHLEAYRQAAQGRPIRLFVNVGGSSVNVGTCEAAAPRPGIVRRLPACLPDGQGLLHHFFGEGVPVIHLLNVRRLARDHGLSVPEPGRRAETIGEKASFGGHRVPNTTPPRGFENG